MTSLIDNYKMILDFDIMINAVIEVFEEGGLDAENLLKTLKDVKKCRTTEGKITIIQEFIEQESLF